MAEFRSDSALEVQIDIEMGATLEDIVTVLRNVTIPRKDLAQRVPSYWRGYLEGNPPELPSFPGEPKSETPKVITASKLLSAPRPVYPEEARQYGFQGVVRFIAEITETGDIGSLMILDPAGAGFDENAADAVYKWKYSPTLVDGKPVRVVTAITVNYEFRR